MSWNRNCQWMVVAVTVFVAVGTARGESKAQKTAKLTPKLRASNSSSNSLSAPATVTNPQVSSAPFSPSLFGMLDVRAGYFSKTGKHDTENAAELGVNLTPTVKLSYLQGFNTSIYNNPDTTNGEAALLDAGYLRSKFKNLWQSNDKLTSFSMEQRLYLFNPFFQKDINMITAFRNYFKLSQKVAESVTLTLMEVPILFVNGSTGVRNSANPVFENRVIFVTDVNLTQKLSLSVPVFFHQTRFANYRDGASNNDRWGYVLWVNPELDYQINNNVMVGLAYSNWSNLVASDLSKTNFGSGFEDGVYQAIVTLTF